MNRFLDSCASLTLFTESSRGVESSFAMDRETSNGGGVLFFLAMILILCTLSYRRGDRGRKGER